MVPANRPSLLPALLQYGFGLVLCLILILFLRVHHLPWAGHLAYLAVLFFFLLSIYLNPPRRPMSH